MAFMPLPHYKVIRFHCESLGVSEDAPACESLIAAALLEAPDGSHIERSRSFLAYSGIMKDAEQFPWQVAQWLRRLMLEGG